MSDRLFGAPLTIFAGRFGSGKSEAAINFAIRLAGNVGPDHATGTDGVILIDLDIVTPYFRSREMAGAMQEHGVEVIAPSAVSQHLDTPGIIPEILGAIQQTDKPVVLDVGGDRQGARALGQFSPSIQDRGYTMHFVVNPYRPFTNSLEGLYSSITEIESSARLRVTSLISNPNLIGETTLESINEGHARVVEYAKELELPIAFVCVERRWLNRLSLDHFVQPLLVLNRHFVMAWE